MTVADLLIKNCSQLLTMEDGTIGMIENGAVAVGNGKILFAGKEKDLAGQVDLKKDCMVIDAGNSVVMPAFVDPHTHAIFAGDRSDELPLKVAGKSYTEIAKMGGGILKTVKATRSSTEDELYKIVIERVGHFISSGTCTIEIKTGYGLSLDDELKLTRVLKKVKKRFSEIEITFLGAHAFPPDRERSEYVNEIINNMIPEVSKMGGASFIDVFCEPGFFTYDESRQILTKGKQYGLIPKIHADEFEDSHGASLSAEVKAVSADHLIKSSEDGLEAMSRSNVVPVLLPVTTFTSFINSKPKIEYMRRLEMPMAIGSDFNPNAMSINPWLTMWLSLYSYRMTMEEVLMGMTVNGAKAIGKEKEVGTLSVGKKASILITDVKGYAELFSNLPVTHTSKVITGNYVIKN